MSLLRRASSPVALALRILLAIMLIWVLQDSRLEVAPRAIAAAGKSLAEGQAAQAIAEYRSALQAQPGDPWLLDRLVDSSLAAQRPDIAAAFLEQRASLSRWSPALYSKMADIRIAQGQPDQALFYWRVSLDGSQSDIPTLRKLVEHDINAQDWVAAITILNQLTGLDPADNQAQYQLGLLQLPTDQVAGFAALDRASVDPEYRATAAALHTAATAQANSSSAAVSFQFGLALMAAQAWPYAEHALATAIDQGNTTPAVLAFMGVTQDQQGRNGWLLINQAFASAPLDPTVNYAVALHWRLVGDTDKALAALTRAEALDPHNPAIAAEMGMNYQTAGRLDDAAVWFNLAVVLAPNNVGFRTLLAGFYSDSHYNLQGGGLDAIRNIAAEYPNDADIHASLGWALFSTGDFEGAHIELDKALMLDPTNVRARYYTAIDLEYRGDLQGAIADYVYVYQDVPDNSFKDLAAGALKRLNYSLDPDKVK